MIGEGGFDVLSVDDFSGGMTDFPLTESKRFGEKFENFLITPEKTPLVRPGSQLFDSGMEAITAYGRAADLFAGNVYGAERLFVRTADKLWTQTGAGVWAEVTSPSGGQLYPAGLALTDNTLSQINRVYNRLFISAHDGTKFVSLMEVYRDQGNAFRVVNAGLPKYPDNLSSADRATLLAEAIAFANELKAKMVAHFADAVNHPIGAHVYAFAADATTLPTLIALIKNLAQAQNNHVTDARKGNNEFFSITSYHNNTPNFGNFYMPSLGVLELVEDCIPVLNQLQFIFNFHTYAFNTSMTGKLHPGPQHLSTSAVLVINKKPTVTGVAGSVAYTAISTPLWTDLNANVAFMNQHYANTAGYGTHSAADVDSPISETATSDLTCAVVIYKFAHHFSKHQVRNDIHGGAENNAYKTTYTYAYFRQSQSNDNYRYIDDPSTAAGWTKLATIAKDIMTKTIQHADQGAARHVAAADPGNYQFMFVPEVGFSRFGLAFTYRRSRTDSTGSTFVDLSTPFTYDTGPICNSYKLNNYVNSPVVIAQVYELAFAISATNFAAFPVTTENWIESTITTDIYRTLAGGDVPYRIYSKSYDEANFVDATPDNQLTEFPRLYTVGGVVPNDPAPKARCMAVVNNHAWFGGVLELVDGVETFFGNKLRQSKYENYGAAPETFYSLFPSNIVSVGGAGVTPVVICEKGIYRVDGVFGSTGSGGHRLQEISSSVGGVSATGTINVKSHVYFPGLDGFYRTDGYEVQLLSKHLKTSYLARTNTDTKRKAIRVAYSSKENAVYWTMQSGTTYPDETWVLHLDQPIEDNKACFTKLVGITSMRPTALAFFGNDLVRGDYDGFVFRHSDNLLTDLEVNRTTGALTGRTEYVGYLYASVAHNFGTSKYRKWVTECDVTLKATTNVSFQIQYVNDQGRISGNCTEIKYRGVPAGLIEQKRHFPSGGLRCLYKQVKFTNANVIITNSDTLGVGFINKAALQITLGVGAFPADSVGMYLYFENDGYQKKFKITALGLHDAIFEETDGAGSCPVNGNYKWLIRGYPKDERVEIVSYNLPFTVMSNSKDTRKESLGGNA